MAKTIVGVFDSGVGGLAIARAIEKDVHDCSIFYANDKQHLPYGNKSTEELIGYVLPILQDMENKGCEVIVVACNTVTTTIIEELRQQIKVPLIGMEPMVKPAAQYTKTGVIAVCATPLTLASKRYNWLKERYAQDIKILEPNCSDWAYMIESRQIDHQHIDNLVQDALSKEADVIVLGCTHYHWIEEEIKRIAGSRAIVMQSEEAIIRRLKHVLATQDLKQRA